MIQFSVSGSNTFKSTTGSISAALYNCMITTKNSKNVVDLTKNGYITIPEKNLPFSKDFYISMSLYIDSTAGDNQILLESKRIPIVISLVKKTVSSYVIDAALTAGGKKKSATSTLTIAKQKWVKVEFALRENEFTVLVDGKVYCRRYLTDNITVSSSQTTSLKIGKSNILLESISFDNTFSADLTSKLDDAANTGVGEIDSKYQDLMLSKKDIGSAISADTKWQSSSACYYRKFSKGVIVWSPTYHAVFMSTQIFNKYSNLLSNTAIGLPMEDETEVSSYKVSYCRFDCGTIFLNKVKNVAYFISANILEAYAEQGLYESKGGLPISDVISLKIDGAQVDYARFDNFTIITTNISGGDRSAHCIHSTLASYYISKYSSLSCGALLNFYEGYKDSKTEVFYLECSKKVICLICSASGTTANKTYSISRAFEVEKDIFNYLIQHDVINPRKNYGKYKYPKATYTKTSKGVIYHNCLYGVIAKYSDTVIRGFTDFKIVLNSIKSGSINDGVGDRTAEMYIEVNLKRNNQNIVSSQRWPEYDKHKHGGSSFSIIYEGNRADSSHPKGTNVYYAFDNMQGEDLIYFHVKVYDWDKCSGNDYLGSYTINFDINTGWGLVKDILTTSQRGGFSQNTSYTSAIYSEMYLMHQGSDNRNGLQNIKLTFRVETSHEPVNIDEYFRKYAYWSIDNYTTNGSIDRSTFNTVFHANSGKWYDWLIHTWDSIWFEIVKANFSGEKGQCFGLSNEALHAIHGNSSYNIPLNEWIVANNGSAETYVGTISNVKSTFGNLIREKHLYQGGWKHVQMIIDKAINGTLLNPTTAFRDIKSILSRDKYCLVNLFGNGGHTVLAYKYDSSKIYVADCNHPWWEYKNDKNSSYITLTSDTVKKCKLVWKNGSGSESSKTYNYCYGTPYSVIASEPRCPSWFGIASEVLNVVINSGNFVANNLREFIFMIATGDCEVSVSGNNAKMQTYNLPAFGASANTSSTPLDFKIIIGTAEGDVDMTVKNPTGKTPKQYIITRKHKYSLVARNAGGTFNVKLRNLGRAKPTLEEVRFKKLRSTTLSASNVVITDETW